jgi:small subunit ribosomal protein S16
MAVKIRLKRMGRTHRPFYRLNAIEDRSPRDGKPIEELGWFNPMESDKDKQLKVDVDKAVAWLNKGAIPSPTASSLLKRLGVEHKMLRLPKPGKPKKAEGEGDDAAAEGEAKSDA